MRNQSKYSKKATPKTDPDYRRSPAPNNIIKTVKKNANLNNIIEVTQENYTHRLNEQNSQNIGLTTQQKKHKNLFQRSYECFKDIVPCLKKDHEISMIVREDEIVRTIEKLKTEKLNHKPYLPPLEKKKKTLVIDLDGTLLFSTFIEPQNYDFCSQLPYRSSKVKIYTQLRFGVQSFLFQMSKIYEIVLYTARKQVYTDKMLEIIDKKHWISHVLHKQKCIKLNNVYHLKSMKVLGRNSNDVVFFDHDPVSGILQPQNFCQIKCFSGEKNDRQLVKIMSFLKQISAKKTVAPVYKHFEQFKNKQIQLQFLNLVSNETQAYQQYSESKRHPLKILKSERKAAQVSLIEKTTENSPKQSQRDRSSETNKQNIVYCDIEQCIERKKKKYGHKKTNSEVQSLAKKVNDNDDEQEEEQQKHEQSGCALRTRNQANNM